MVKRAPARKRPRKAKPGTKGLAPAECRLIEPSAAAAEVTEAIEKAGGHLVGSYKEPLGGHPVLLAILPIDAVEPTPFQRDLSDAHHKRLADVINKTGRFLDPIIAVVAPKGGFWTPNGRHRLEAMRRLGAKSITALVVADREVAWQILALNTEKAHKLKERGLVSPYLRSFVVARINPLRWIKGEPPPLEEVLKMMRERAAKFNVEKIKPQDLAGAAGSPDEAT